MKRMRIIMTALTILFAAAAITSCNEDPQKTGGATTDVKADKEPCCTVTCRKGACSSYSSPCTCTCVSGQPLCGGLDQEGSVSKNGVVNIITTTPEQIAIYDKEIRYIREELHNNAAAEALSKIRKLFIDNNYTLNTQAAVEAYYAHLSVYVKFVKSLPEETQEYLDGIE